MAAESEFEPRRIGRTNCDDGPHFGKKSTRFDYVMKNTTGDDDYPDEACLPWYHGNIQVDNLQVNNDVDVTGTVTGGVVRSGSHILSNKKNFDIPHPNKPGWRLRHTCLEGPENAVFFRGRLTNKNVIELTDCGCARVCHCPPSSGKSLANLFSQSLMRLIQCKY